MPKIIHEYWYAFGTSYFSHYELRVEKETPKMFYGKVFRTGGLTSLGNFAAKKDSLDQVIEIKTMTRLKYKVQINLEDEAAARNMAKQLIYNHIIQIAEEVLRR